MLEERGRLDLLTAGFSGFDVLVVGMVWQMLAAHHHCTSNIPIPYPFGSIEANIR